MCLFGLVDCFLPAAVTPVLSSCAIDPQDVSVTMVINADLVGGIKTTPLLPSCCSSCCKESIVSDKPCHLPSSSIMLEDVRQPPSLESTCMCC